jgi:hypothetical protein
MSRSGHSGRPSAAKATDFVRRVVGSLQAEVEQQRVRQWPLAEHHDVAALGSARDDYASLRRTVISIQEELKELKVKTRILNTRTAKTQGKTEALEVRLDDLEHDGSKSDEGDVNEDASDNAGNAAGADLSISVAAVRRSAQDGNWVAISGHLWKESPDSSSALTLVSDSEVLDSLGEPWADFSCYTDAELAALGVVRAGSARTVSNPATGTTMEAAELEYKSTKAERAYAKTKAVANIATQLQDTSDY